VREYYIILSYDGPIVVEVVVVEVVVVVVVIVVVVVVVVPASLYASYLRPKNVQYKTVKKTSRKFRSLS
jgi:hypothetical protein